MIFKSIDFLLKDIWRIPLREASQFVAFCLRTLRIVVLALRGYYHDKCYLRAAALTFYSMLSIVPVAALAFGIAKGFGFEGTLEAQLIKKFPGHIEVIVEVVTFAKGILQNTRGGVIAGVGVVFLLWVLIKLLGNIECAFNDIWGVKRPRRMVRKFSDYLSMLIVGPIFFVVASSINVLAIALITTVTAKFTVLETLGPVVFAIVKIMPYALVWILFAFIYIVMPNTKVRFRYGIVAGIFAGTMYQITQWAYIHFQVGVATTNAIYGSFAALPLFLIWLQISWLIVLFGAEMSYALQNVDSYEFEPDCKNVSYSMKQLITLRIVTAIIKNFCDGGKVMGDEDIAHDIGTPIRLVTQILKELLDAKIIAEIIADNGKTSYQPAHDVERYTMTYVITALENSGSSTVPIANSQEIKAIKKSLETFSKTSEKTQENHLLKDL